MHLCSATGICTTSAQVKNICESQFSVASGFRSRALLKTITRWFLVSVAALAVGDAGQDSGVGGDASAVAVSGGV